MSEHEDILMGFDAISDRLNDADQLVRAIRASYLQVAQKNFSLRELVKNIESGDRTPAWALNEAMERIAKARELADYMASNPNHFTTIDVRDGAAKIRDVLDGNHGT